MIRTFLAIALEESIRRVLVARQQEWCKRLPPASWIGSHALHITMKFLGDTPKEQIDVLRDAVAIGMKEVTSFPIRLQGVGVFPNVHAPRILWAGFSSGQELLCSVAERLDECLAPMGFPKEMKSFHPHVTMARIKRDNKAFGQALHQLRILNNSFQFESGRVEKITLYKSDLTPSGSVYTPLWEVPFPE